LVTQLLRFGGQQTRLTVAAVALTFLFFGASAKPLSFKALRPGTETYGLPTAFRVLRNGEMPPSTPLGYFSDYSWKDHRALMEYLRGHTTPPDPGRQPAGRAHLGRHQRDPEAHGAARRLELFGDVSHCLAGRA